MRRIIEAAREGKTVLEVPVYDGAETGEKVYNTLTVIGRAIPPDERVPTDAAAGKAELAGMMRWPVTVSYFDRAKTGGEQAPVYSIKFELYENGISRALVLDYNDFVISGELDDARNPRQQALQVAALRRGARVRCRCVDTRSVVVFGPVERQAPHHGFLAEFLAQPVDRLLGLGGPPVEQIGMVGAVGRRQAPKRRYR